MVPAIMSRDSPYADFYRATQGTRHLYQVDIIRGFRVAFTSDSTSKMAHAAVKKWKEAGTASLIYVQPMNEHAEDYVSGDNAFLILLFSSLLF